MSGKVCPIMSKLMHDPQYESNNFVRLASTSLYRVYCLKEECESWHQKYGFCKLIEKEWDE